LAKKKKKCIRKPKLGGEVNFEKVTPKIRRHFVPV